MQPTYTIEELKERIPQLDNEGIKALHQLINDEMYRYDYAEILLIYELMMSRIRFLYFLALSTPGGYLGVNFINPDDRQPYS